MRVLLYSHHSGNGEIDEYVTRSLQNIAHNFDSIYFLTNMVDPMIGPDGATSVFFDSRNDFESYAGFFFRSPEVVSGASMLYLVNDSILIQASVRLPRSPRIDVFGPVESRQQGAHIQSYFMEFHNRETIDVTRLSLLAFKPKHVGDFRVRVPES